MLDLARITELQLKIMSEIDIIGLGAIDRIKYGKILIGNYKKAKQIINSGTEHSKYWTTVLVFCQENLEELVTALESLFMIEDESLTQSVLIGYTDLLSQIKYLEFTDEVQYGNKSDTEINIDEYMDIL